MRYRIVTIAGLFFVIALPAHAYNVYRCKDNNGNVVFSQTLCPDTTSEFVQVEPATGEDDPSRYNKSLIERANDKKQLKNRNKKPPTKISNIVKSNKRPERNNSALCSKYKNKVKNTQDEMRTGYSSKQGEYLRSRLREEKKKLKQYCG